MILIEETRDHELVAALNEEVQNLHHEMHPAIFKLFNKEETTKAIETFLQDENCRAFVATKERVPVGYIVFMLKEVKENAFHYNMKILYIDQVCVLKKYRGQGIGTLLLQKAEQLAKELNINRIELDHWSTNTIAARQFRRHGYNLFKEKLWKLL